MLKNFTLGFILLSFSFAGYTQYTRHIIQFTDKKGTLSTLANPSTYLSAKAIERRNRQNIVIDSTDLPISKTYLDSIASVPNVTIMNRSKWLNQILIITSDPNALTKINSFPFVKNVTAIAPVANQGEEVISKKFEPLYELKEELISGPNRQQKTGGTTGVQIDHGTMFNQIHFHQGDFLHDLGFTGRGVTFAVLDAGFRSYKTNPAFDSIRLQGRLLGEWDYVLNESSVNEDDAHGANCFSIIGANRPGIVVGSAPHSSFWLLRTEDVGSEYPVEEQNWAAAAEFADSVGVDMISSSLGYNLFDNPVYNHTYPERNGNTSIVTRAADFAARKGIIVMNSAGNDGGRADDYRFVSCPADGDSVVAVGSTNYAGNISNFSCWGPNSAGKIKPNVVSVGSGTIAANTAGNPAAGSGTSYANPNLAGLVACLWQAFPEYSNMQLIDAVQRSAHKFDNPDDRFGYGIPDFQKAFFRLVTLAFSGTMNAGTCNTSFSWSGKDKKGMKYEIERKIGSATEFTKVATINSESDSFRMNSYTYEDVLLEGNPTDQVTYRLRQYVNADTSIILLTGVYPLVDQCSLGDRLIIRPNPVKESINIVLGTVEDVQKVSIVLTDTKGSILYKSEVTKNSGNLYLSIPSSHLKSGIYILTVRSGKRVLHTRKILK